MVFKFKWAEHDIALICYLTLSDEYSDYQYAISQRFHNYESNHQIQKSKSTLRNEMKRINNGYLQE